MGTKRGARRQLPIVQEELRRRAVAAIHGAMFSASIGQAYRAKGFSDRRWVPGAPEPTGLQLTGSTSGVGDVSLPAYSPDLNQGEMLNQDIKVDTVGRKRGRPQSKLMRNLGSYLNCRQDNPPSAVRYFHEKSVQYAPV